MNFFGRVAAILAAAAAVGLHNSSVLAGGGGSLAGGSLAGRSGTESKLLHVERSLKGSDALGLKGDEAFANSAGVGPGGDAEPRGGKDLRPPMGGASDTAGLGGDVSIGRRLEVPTETCTKGYVECAGGMEVRDDGIETGKTCAAACGDDCCTDSSNACSGFTGSVCMDGSCSGTLACGNSNIGYIVKSCSGFESCYSVGWNGRVGNIVNSCSGEKSCYSVGYEGVSVGNIVDSCSGYYSCYFAGYKGAVGNIDNSCSGVRSCDYLGNNGIVGNIVNSCSGVQSCRFLGWNGGIGNVLDSCKGGHSCNSAFKDIGNARTSDDMNECCNNSDECKDAITLPTTCPSTPPATPPPPPPATPVLNSWALNFITLGANFSATNDDENLSLTYSVSENRKISTKLYAGGCADAPDSTSALLDTTKGAIVKTPHADSFQGPPAMHTLPIDYAVNTTLITSSHFWNNMTNEIKLCQVVQLTEKNPNSEDDFVIIEDIRNITIAFDLSTNFTTGVVSLEGATINSANETTSVEGYIKAFHCDEDENELIDAKLVPNEQFNVCITSKDDDVEIAEIDSMTIKGPNPAGDDSELAVIGEPNGLILIPSITTKEHTSLTKVLIKTRVPTNLFDYEADDATIEVTGSLTIKLKGSRVRKLKLDDGVSGGVGTNRQLQGDASEQEATFDLAIKLDPGVSGDEEGITMNSALSVAAGSSIAGFIVFFATAITFW